MKSVYVVSWITLGVDDLFTQAGWKVYRDNDMKENTNPDLICFTGGADINPSYYGENKHPTTHCNDRRDAFEFDVLGKWIGKKPMVGICRGAQLLNIANGGKMYQHVNNHHGAHTHYDVKGREVTVSSVHHQMMIPPEDQGVVFGWAVRSTRKETADDLIILPSPDHDPETIWFEKNRHLCFQAHPEFGPHSCTDYFFTILDEKIMKAGI